DRSVINYRRLSVAVPGIALSIAADRHQLRLSAKPVSHKMIEGVAAEAERPCYICGEIVDAFQKYKPPVCANALGGAISGQSAFRDADKARHARREIAYISYEGTPVDVIRHL